MDTFEETPQQPRRKRSSDLVWNIVTVVILLCVLCTGGAFLSVFINPTGATNPWPPPTDIIVPTLPFTPTPTITPRFTLQPSWTPTAQEILPTNTPRPTNTPLITDTPIGYQAPSTPTPGGFAFVVQSGSPYYIPGSAIHADAGCNWLGIGGEARKIDGAPFPGAFVQLGGTLGETTFSPPTLTMSGTAPQYGPGGFEFTLAEQPVASQGTLWIQLLDQQNLPLSDKIYFDTRANCDESLVIINFIATR